MKPTITTITIPTSERRAGEAFDAHINEFGGITKAYLPSTWDDVDVEVRVRMSPEQADRLRCDIYEARERLIEMLTGQPSG